MMGVGQRPRVPHGHESQNKSCSRHCHSNQIKSSLQPPSPPLSLFSLSLPLPSFSECIDSWAAKFAHHHGDRDEKEKGHGSERAMSLDKLLVRFLRREAICHACCTHTPTNTPTMLAIS